MHVLKRYFDAALFIVILVLMKPSFANENIIWSPPIQVGKAGEFQQWSSKLKKRFASLVFGQIHSDTAHLDSYMECSEVQELPGTLLCQSYLQKTMNRTFTRMGFFMGAAAGTKAGEFIPLDQPELLNYEKVVAGHNLPGAVVLDFYAQAETKNLLLSEMEIKFKNKILDSKEVQALGSKFYLIGLSAQNVKPSLDVLSHEIRHAEYALKPCYSKIVDHFWRAKLSLSDRKQVIGKLERAYQVNDAILIDEFQAYLLQNHPEDDLLGDVSERLSVQLKEALDLGQCSPLTLRSD